MSGVVDDHLGQYYHVMVGWWFVVEVLNLSVDPMANVLIQDPFVPQRLVKYFRKSYKYFKEKLKKFWILSKWIFKLDKIKACFISMKMRNFLSSCWLLLFSFLDPRRWSLNRSDSPRLLLNLALRNSCRSESSVVLPFSRLRDRRLIRYESSANTDMSFALLSRCQIGTIWRPLYVHL